MKNSPLRQMKEFIKEVWDLKKTMPYHSENSTCCSYEPPYLKTHLRPDPIRMNNKSKL